jgi:hypothetical protein
MANDSVEYDDEDALPGPLALPSRCVVVVVVVDTPLVPASLVPPLLVVEMAGRY